MANLLREELSKNPDVLLYGPENPKDRTSIISFTIKGHESETVVQKLEKLGIVLAVREIYDKKIIRASPHFFNTESEILRVIDTLKKFVITSYSIHYTKLYDKETLPVLHGQKNSVPKSILLKETLSL